MRQLTLVTKQSAEADYATFETVTHGDLVMENLVRTKLVSGGHAANIEESLEATIRKGGGVGESVEQMLLKSSLTGWT